MPDQIIDHRTNTSRKGEVMYEGRKRDLQQMDYLAPQAGGLGGGPPLVSLAPQARGSGRRRAGRMPARGAHGEGGGSTPSPHPDPRATRGGDGMGE